MNSQRLPTYAVFYEQKNIPAYNYVLCYLYILALYDAAALLPATRVQWNEKLVLTVWFSRIWYW